MGGAGQVVQGLIPAQEIGRARDISTGKAHIRAADLRQSTVCLLQTVDAAQPAPHRTRHETAAGRDGLRAILRQPKAGFDAVWMLNHLKPFDLGMVCNHTFRQRETIGEIGNVGGGRHHHRLRGAVKDHRHRHLLWQRTVDRATAIGLHRQAR